MIRRARHTAWFFCSPFVLHFLFFWLFPLAMAFVLAFFEYNMLPGGLLRFVGFSNFRDLLEDNHFKSSFWNTLLFVVGTIPTTTILSLLLALAIEKVRRGSEFFQAAFFLPSLISMVVISTIFKILYASEGTLHAMARWFSGPGALPLLQNPSTALLAIMAMDVWCALGYYTLLFIAGLRAIDPHLYEAARLDGANEWQIISKITIPLLKPVFLLVLVINSIRSFQVFNEIYILTHGGPLDTTTTMVYDIYVTAFDRLEMGSACARGLILVAIIALFTAFQFFLSRDGTWKVVT